MTDLTPLLSDLLVHSHSKQSLPIVTSLTRKLDNFLEEAYSINSKISELLGYLRRVRQPYLSTAPPPRRSTNHERSSEAALYFTDVDREEIDTSSAQVLRDLNANINNLDQAAQLRSTTDTTLIERKYGKKQGFLFRWAAGEGDDPDAGKSDEQLEEEGRASSMDTVRSNVIWYLRNGLQTAAARQQQMVQIRVDREKERERSVLYKAKGLRPALPPPTNESNDDTYGNVDLRGQSIDPAMEADQDAAILAQLTPEQLQLFEEENSSLINHYNDMLSKVTQAEKSVLEISDLQTQLIGELGRQGDMIEQLVTDAHGTDENVRKGNKELKKASERSSTAKGAFWVTVGLCGFLIGWDLVF